MVQDFVHPQYMLFPDSADHFRRAPYVYIYAVANVDWNPQTRISGAWAFWGVGWLLETKPCIAQSNSGTRLKVWLGGPLF